MPKPWNGPCLRAWVSRPVTGAKHVPFYTSRHLAALILFLPCIRLGHVQLDSDNGHGADQTTGTSFILWRQYTSFYALIWESEFRYENQSSELETAVVWVTFGDSCRGLTLTWIQLIRYGNESHDLDSWPEPDSDMTHLFVPSLFIKTPLQKCVDSCIAKKERKSSY